MFGTATEYGYCYWYTQLTGFTDLTDYFLFLLQYSRLYRSVLLGERVGGTVDGGAGVRGKAKVGRGEVRGSCRTRQDAKVRHTYCAVWPTDGHEIHYRYSSGQV